MSEEKPTVLIIDDEQDLKDMVSEELARVGFNVLTCSLITEGMKQLLKKKMDCILIDVHLEDGEGTQIVHSLRQDKNNPNHATPIFVVSGQLSKPIVLKIKNRVSGVFVKPFDLAGLVTKVQEASASTKTES